MINARKWDPKERKYWPYIIPGAWKTPLFSNDMDEVINCAACGKEVKFGDTYTSKQIHNAMGFGYYVCPECAQREREEEQNNGND